MIYQTKPFERLVTAACQPFWACHSVGYQEFIAGLQLISIGELPVGTVKIGEVGDRASRHGLGWGDRTGTARDIKLCREIISADLNKFSVLESPYWFGCLEIVFQHFTYLWKHSATYQDSSLKFECRKICWSIISSAWAEQFIDILRSDLDIRLCQQLKACKKGSRPLGENDLEQIRRLFAGQSDWAWEYRDGTRSEIRI